MSDTPFNPSTEDDQLEQPTLTTLLEDLIANASRDLRVCLPVTVVKVRGNQLVDLQPLLQASYLAKATSTTLPIISFCPVSMPSGLDYSIKYPIAVGDQGLAIFNDRALDAWMSSAGGVTDPGDDSLHDLSDAIYVPGLLTAGQQTTDATQDLVIRNGTASVRLEKNGTFRIQNQGQELISLVTQLLQAHLATLNIIQSAQTITLGGPQPFWAATQQQLAQAVSTAQQIAANLATLQGQ